MNRVNSPEISQTDECRVIIRSRRARLLGDSATYAEYEHSRFAAEESRRLLISPRPVVTQETIDAVIGAIRTIGFMQATIPDKESGL